MLDRVPGVSAAIYEDWVEVTLDLIDHLAALVQAGQIEQAHAALLEAFNSEDTSQAIIQHFRVRVSSCFEFRADTPQMLTSAWMNEHFDDYVNYLVDVSTVLEYTAIHVNPHTAEIEAVSLQGLYDCVIQETGMAIEIMYLDRTAGETCTVHRIESQHVANSTTGHTSETLRLLYRM